MLLNTLNPSTMTARKRNFFQHMKPKHKAGKNEHVFSTATTARKKVVYNNQIKKAHTN